MKIASRERRVLWWAWIGVVVWDGILGFGALENLRSHKPLFSYHHPQDLIVLCFPAVGMALLVFAIRQIVLWCTYGQTYFTSDEEQFPLGGRLHGRIMLPGTGVRSLQRRFHLKLDYQMGTGNETCTVWSNTYSVELAPDGSIPIEFSLPAQLEPKVFLLSGAPIVWYLKVNEIGGGFRSFAAGYSLPSAEKTYQAFQDKLFRS